MKAGFIRANAEPHTGNGAIANIGQELQLIRDGDVEQLAVVLQHTAQEPPRLGPGLERRVQAATGLAVAGPGARDHRKDPPGPDGKTGCGTPGEKGIVGEVEDSFRRKSKGLSKRGRGIGRRNCESSGGGVAVA